jgi:DNA (cytosine-5)-methyltransferase 1
MSTDVKRAISLFSNCGAGDVGYAKAGFHFDVMAELDPRRLEVCLLNHPSAVGISGDLRRTWPIVVKEYRKRAGRVAPSLLAACPPCQGMSSAKSGRGKAADADAGSRDKRNLLVTVIARVALELRPKIVVVENVQAFLTRKIRHPETKKAISAGRLLIEALGTSYAAFPLVTDLCDFGVPQTRKRTFLTFVRRSHPGLRLLKQFGASPYPVPTYSEDFGGAPIILREALARFNLPSLDARFPEKAASKRRQGMHFVPIWRDRRYPMVAAIPPHTGKGAWDNNRCEKCGEVKVGPDDVSCPFCDMPLLRPVVGSPKGKFRLVNGFRSSSYSRMRSDRPAATITTASGHLGSDHTIHPCENRLFSPLECARLQTFPATFRWGGAIGKYGPTHVRQMIGEAVPPLFTKKHGQILMSLLCGWLKLPLLPVSDKRVREARRKLCNSLEGESRAARLGSVVTHQRHLGG